MKKLKENNNLIQNISASLTILPALFHLLPPDKFKEPAKELIKSAFSLDERVRIIGEENLPEEGPVYFICEHRDIFDPVFLVASMLDLTGNFTHYVMRDNFLFGAVNLWARKYFDSIFFPRDNPYKRKKALIKSLEDVATILDNKGYIALCPAATRTKNGSPYFVYLSEKEKRHFEKLESDGELTHKIRSREFGVERMAKRSLSFLKKFDGNVNVIPVGITFNDVSKKIYFNLGQPVAYGKKMPKREQNEIMNHSVEQLANLKVIGHQILPYFFYELGMQEKGIKTHFGVDRGISILNIYRGMNKLLNELSNKHSFFDVDFYNESGKLGLSWEALGNYIGYFVKKGILIRKSKYPPERYALNVEKARETEISKRFKEFSPVLYARNDILFTEGIKESFLESLFYMRALEDETNHL